MTFLVSIRRSNSELQEDLWQSNSIVAHLKLLFLEVYSSHVTMKLLLLVLFECKCELSLPLMLKTVSFILNSLGALVDFKLASCVIIYTVLVHVLLRACLLLYVVYIASKQSADFRSDNTLNIWAREKSHH